MVRTKADKVAAILIIGECRKNLHAAERLFNERYPDRTMSRTYLRELLHKFEATGSIEDAKRSGRPTVSDDKKIDIIAEMVVNPTSSTAQVASICEVSKSTVHRVLAKNKFHPYKLKMVHQLSDDDPDRRLELCDIMMNKIDRNQHYIKTICFSDESTFCLNGNVNTQNVRYWSDTNPHIFREKHTQFPEKVNVWAGILGNHIVGPIFLNTNLTGEVYLEMLQNAIEPLILEILEDNPDEFGNLEITFQQDGAPAHYYGAVRRYLDEEYRGRWIGRRGPTEWPARSPDLTPLDFFLWGYLKSKVYATAPDSMDVLKQRITEECRAISADTFERVRQEFINRIHYCQEVDGAHFEHLL